MSVTIEHQEQPSQTALITVNGRLLLGPGCIEMERLIASLLDRGYRYLTIDVTGLTHIDSTGMGRFIDTYSKLKKSGGSVRIVGAAGPVREIFKVTRLDSIFRIE